MYAWPYSSSINKPISLLIKNPNSVRSISVRVLAYSYDGATNTQYQKPFGDKFYGEWIFDRHFDTVSLTGYSSSATRNDLLSYYLSSGAQATLWLDSFKF